MKKHSHKIILALSALLCWSEFVHADEGNCGVGEEQVMVQPETTSYRIVPGQYEWVDGEVGGSSLEYRVVPPVFETVDDSYVLQAATKEDIGWGTTAHIPAITKSYEKKNIAHEAYPVAKFVTNLVKDGRTRVQIKQPKYEAVTVPAQMRTITRMKPCQMVSAAISVEK